jgi:hypothetical protein
VCPRVFFSEPRFIGIDREVPPSSITERDRKKTVSLAFPIWFFRKKTVENGNDKEDGGRLFPLPFLLSLPLFLPHRPLSALGLPYVFFSSIRKKKYPPCRQNKKKTQSFLSRPNELSLSFSTCSYPSKAMSSLELPSCCFSKSGTRRLGGGERRGRMGQMVASHSDTYTHSPTHTTLACLHILVRL